MSSMPFPHPPPRILAVIVLYKTAPRDSASYQTLLQSHALQETVDLGIILYDNSPPTALPTGMPANVRYVADAQNRGLSTAYNLALDVALAEGYDWILTLDQDTHLPLETFRILAGILGSLIDRPDVGAIAPEIHAAGRIISPNYYAAGAWPRWFPEGYSGIPELDVYAFNSGSLVRTAALRQIGGYAAWFWLDNSDSMLYRQLAKFGKRVYVAGEWKLEHDFSMMNLQEKVSPERYRMILLTESAFWDMEMNALAGLERTARLAGRMVKHMLRKDDAGLRKLTRQALWARLFQTRKRRIARWKEATEKRLGGPPDAWRES
jgi:GT2 family glycosyltransferase